MQFTHVSSRANAMKSFRLRCGSLIRISHHRLPRSSCFGKSGGLSISAGRCLVSLLGNGFFREGLVTLAEETRLELAQV